MNLNTESSKRRIVMLANGHVPFDTRIFFKEAVSLTSAGYEVSIIIPHSKNEQVHGISILAVSKTSKGWEKLIINPWNIFKKSLSQPRDAVYHIHDSDILLVGVLLKFLGRRIVYDAHEDTPLQIMLQHWLPGIFKMPYRWYYFSLEKICGWLFDRIIIAEPVIGKYFPESKTYLVRNFPIAEPFQQHVQTPYLSRKKRLVYVGALSEKRGLFEMLQGAQLASRDASFEFILGGKFSPPTLENIVMSQYHVTFLSWVAFEEMVDLLFDAQVGIIVPHPVERYKTNYPVKLFEFMAAGLPVIASREGEAGRFVEEAQCGILVDPMNPSEIAEAINWIFTHPEEAAFMGKRGQDLIFRKYNWEKERNVLLDVYERLFK